MGDDGLLWRHEGDHGAQAREFDRAFIQATTPFELLAKRTERGHRVWVVVKQALQARRHGDGCGLVHAGLPLRFPNSFERSRAGVVEVNVLRLNPFDDYPFHQHVMPVDVPATSDPHFNDGYWWSWYSEGCYFFCGLRVHPNNNVMDGYAGVVFGGVQHNIRVSRALRPDTNTLRVGPLSVEIVQPLQAQRITLDENPTGMTFDVTARASTPMFVESPHIHYRYGRVLNHVIRYSGCIRASGAATVAGDRVNIDNWYGARDHSWGIRSSMGPYVPIGGIPEPDDTDKRALRLWVPFETDGDSGFFHLHEDRSGRTLDFEGRLYRPDGTTVSLATARHKLTYHHGTRRLKSGEFTLVGQDGTEQRYSFEVVCEPAHPQGFGYTRGWSDGGNPGVYRGVEYAESDHFDVSDPSGRAGPEYIEPKRRLGGTEFAARCTGPDGSTGMAHVEHMIYPPYEPYGFLA